MSRRSAIILAIYVVAIVAFHLSLPTVQAFGMGYLAGFGSGFLTGLVLGYLADRIVLVPVVDWFERRSRRGG